MEGTVKFFNEEKGYGFIEQDGSNDIFFHVSDIENNDELTKGDSIQFEVAPGQRGDKAVKIAKI